MTENKNVTSAKQLELELTVLKEIEADGVGMGVLSNGAAYLTGRGLARICGIEASNIVKLTNDWQETPAKPRVAKIKGIIREGEADDGSAFIAIRRGGTIYHAFPEHVCMAVLEYYALDAVQGNNHALKAFRTLARKGFVDFVYDQVGLKRGSSIRDFSTKQFMDRIGMIEGAVPVGYFCVFREIADMFATLISADIQIDSGFVPDISVGLGWSKFWRDDNLDAVYGLRQKFEYLFPEYYPQSAAGPLEVFCYPEEALPEFRKWMREVYNIEKLPTYLTGKVKSGSIEAAKATAIADAYKRPRAIAAN